MYLLTEFIRLLEQRGHIFPQDPHAVTESLRHTSGDFTHKIHQRAQILDRDHQLRNLLENHQHKLQFALRVACVIWLIFGFVSTYGLMKHTHLNFFLILLGALGVNWLMLLIWLGNACFNKPKKSLFLPNLLHRQNNLVNQTWAQLYGELALRPQAMWRKGAYSHLLAICGLSGMLLAALFLLTVRQYSFNWESTLLSNQAFASSVNALAWLPEKLGFAVPDASAIIAGRNSHDTSHAASWGSLLLACMLCYGIVPRVLAWAFCVWQVGRSPSDINIQLPYYQNIIQKWQRNITDSDHDYRPDPIAPPVIVSQPIADNSAFWAVLLDAPHDNPQWFAHLLGKDWLDCGVADSRESIAQLAEKLAQQPTQLLVGVRANRAPDRGQIRTLGKWAAQAQHGIVVKLLSADDDEMLAQWQQILHENAWAWVK